jgi:hypothetical protein
MVEVDKKTAGQIPAQKMAVPGQSADVLATSKTAEVNSSETKTEDPFAGSPALGQQAQTSSQPAQTTPATGEVKKDVSPETQQPADKKEGEPKKKSSWWIWLIIIFALIIAGGLVYYFFFL